MKLLKLPLAALLISLLTAQYSRAQDSPRDIDWELLAEVNFEDQYFEELEGWYLVPQFSDTVRQYDGKQVAIRGYIIPIDVEEGRYALSAYPYNNCFFCGGAGPESVLTLDFRDPPPRYDTDDYQTFRGQLELNDQDQKEFIYILRQARPYSE